MQAIDNGSGSARREGAFALAAPLEDRPGTTLTGVYAHGGLTHLLANALALSFVGPFVVRATTPVRIHAVFAAIAAS